MKRLDHCLFVVFFAFVLSFGLLSWGQQAKRGNLRAVDMVVTNEVDPTKDFHWDSYQNVLWRSVFSNGYIIVKAITNENIRVDLIPANNDSEVK